jgi:hypothetical protein
MKIDKVSKKELLQVVTDLQDALYDVTINEAAVVSHVRQALALAVSRLIETLTGEKFKDDIGATELLSQLRQALELIDHAKTIDSLATAMHEVMKQISTFSPELAKTLERDDDVHTLVSTITQTASRIASLSTHKTIETLAEAADKKLHHTGKLKFFDPTKQVLQVITRQGSEPTAWVRCEMRDITERYGKLASVTNNIDPRTKSVVINTGTFKYKSLKTNAFLLSLHAAECIFREILYTDTGVVDVDQLDTLMDNFYNVCFESLNNQLQDK